MIDFELDFKYENSSRKALDSVSGQVEKGRCIVLCGSSGCGKSTLLRCMNGLIPQFYEGELKGWCRLQGRDSSKQPIGETGRLAGSVFQDPRSQFFTMNSTSELAFGLENFGFSRQQMEKRIESAFESFGLQRLKDRNVFELSSGERQLTAILAAWALDTDIFLMDEPTANLDWSAIKNLRAMLEKLKAQGKTLIISEHRLYYLSGLGDEYWFMEQGEIRKKLSAAQMQQLSRQELQSMGLRTRDLSLVKNGDKQLLSQEKHVFRADNISFSYKKKGRNILQNLSLQAESGQITGLVGHNGCGKTTLGKLAAGLYKPGSGSFSYDGKVLSEKELSNKSIFIMQEAEFQFFTNSVLNELNYGCRPDEKREARIKELLTACNMWQCRNQHPFTLSGGQMQKLVLIMACLSEKPVVILDEPTAGLDYLSLKCAGELIREMSKTKIVFIISHDPELLAGVCTRALGIKEGKVLNEFDLLKDSGYEQLRSFMENNMEPEESAPPEPERKTGLLDPRIKLLVFLLAMICGIGTHQGMILGCYMAVLLCLALERKDKACAGGMISMAAIFWLYNTFPGVATAFIISFFPRMFLICFAAAMIVQQSEAPRTLAALRKLKVPEKLIMIFAVTFRFFPVLKKDISIMNQSIKTRGFYPGFADKLRAVPEYLEIMIVPMVFRVIRIAEALSASAETRGISLPGRRESYIELAIGKRDICILCLTAVFIAAGLII